MIPTITTAAKTTTANTMMEIMQENTTSTRTTGGTMRWVLPLGADLVRCAIPRARVNRLGNATALAVSGGLRRSRGIAPPNHSSPKVDVSASRSALVRSAA